MGPPAPEGCVGQVWEGTSPRWAGAPPHQGPRGLGLKTLGEGGASTLLGGQASPPGHRPSPLDGIWRGPAPSPLPVYIVGVLGLPNTRVFISPGAALPLSLLVSRSAWRSPAGVPCSSITTTPLCCCWTESSPTSPSLLAGSSHGRRHRAERVLNSEVSYVWYLICRIVKTYDYINRVDKRFRLAIFKGMKMHSLSLSLLVSP